MTNLFAQEQWERRGENEARIQSLEVSRTTDEATLAALPRGRIGFAYVTGNQGAIVAEVDLTFLTVSVTVATGRHLKITGFGDFINDTANGAAAMFIYFGGVQVGRFFTPPSPVANQPMGAHPTAVVDPSPGTYTVKLRAARSNTGTVTLEAGATFPAFLLVEDMGAA